MHLSWITGVYLFSHAVPSAENCSKVFLSSSSTRWQFFNFDVNGIFLTYIQLCQLPNSKKCKKLLQKNLNRQLYCNPHWEKVRISFQPYLLSHMVPRAENSSKVFPSLRSTRWQLWILMLMDSLRLTSNLAKKPEP